MKNLNSALSDLQHTEIAGAGEKMQYLIHDQNDNTIRFALKYPCRLSASTMEQASLALVNRADILHASFHPGNIEAFWKINTNITSEDCFHFVKTDGDPLLPAQQIMLRPVLPDDKTQLHCTLIQSDASSAVVLSISHLCVDGSDGRYLLEKLMEAYRLITETGNADQLKVKDGSRSVFQLYEELSARDYFSALKPSMSPVKSEFPFPEDAPGTPHIETRILDASLVQNMKAFAKAEGATLNDMLLAACYRAYAKLPQIDAAAPMSIMSMMDLRRHCTSGETEGLCNLSGPFPTVLEHGISGGFSETLSEISRQTGRAKQDPTAGMGGMPLIHTSLKITPLKILIKVAQKVYGNMSIGLTNMGNIPMDNLIADNTVPCQGLFAGPLKKKRGMQISAAGFNGSIALCCIGEYGEEDAALIRFMLDAIWQELSQAIL